MTEQYRKINIVKDIIDAHNHAFDEELTKLRERRVPSRFKNMARRKYAKHRSK